MRSKTRFSALEKYVDPSPDRHPLMTEVARIAVFRGLSQETLAKLYGEAVGSPRHNGGNIDKHFTRKTSRPPQEHVQIGYATALDVPRRYLNLLVYPFKPEPVGVKAFALIDAHLLPGDMEPLFEDNVISEAVELMLADPILRDECLHAGFLAEYRQRYLTNSRWTTRLPIAPDAIDCTNASAAYVGRWAGVSNVLREQRGFDLASRVRRKDAWLIEREEFLTQTWLSLQTVLGDYTEPVELLRIDEWKALESIFMMIFNRRNYATDKMLDRLRKHRNWDYFESGEWTARHNELFQLKSK
ncbi:MAG TPA: hypothetical protein VGF98_05005 [Candidatus Tumulicola sp.]